MRAVQELLALGNKNEADPREAEVHDHLEPHEAEVHDHPDPHETEVHDHLEVHGHLEESLDDCADWHSLDAVCSSRSSSPGASFVTVLSDGDATGESLHWTEENLDEPRELVQATAGLSAFCCPVEVVPNPAQALRMARGRPHWRRRRADSP